MAHWSMGRGRQALVMDVEGERARWCGARSTGGGDGAPRTTPHTSHHTSIQGALTTSSCRGHTEVNNLSLNRSALSMLPQLGGRSFGNGCGSVQRRPRSGAVWMLICKHPRGRCSESDESMSSCLLPIFHFFIVSLPVSSCSLLLPPQCSFDPPPCVCAAPFSRPLWRPCVQRVYFPYMAQRASPWVRRGAM